MNITCVLTFMKLLSTLGFLLRSCTYHYVCCALCSNELQLEFYSAEKAENGEIAAQQILARVAARVYACSNRSAKMTFVSHVAMRVGGLEALITTLLRELTGISKLAPCLPAHVTMIPWGGSLNTGTLAKRLHPSAVFVSTGRKRFFCSAPPRLNISVFFTSQ